MAIGGGGGGGDVSGCGSDGVMAASPVSSTQMHDNAIAASPLSVGEMRAVPITTRLAAVDDAVSPELIFLGTSCNAM
jgi:hypothetical protein